MRALQAMVMLLGALAVLMTGAVPASALAGDGSAPPCHQTAAHHGEDPTQDPAPGKATKAMNCCVACVSAPALHPPVRGRVAAPRPLTTASPMTLPSGERPAPEPHPPRTGLS